VPLIAWGYVAAVTGLLFGFLGGITAVAAATGFLAISMAVERGIPVAAFPVFVAAEIIGTTTPRPPRRVALAPRTGIVAAARVRADLAVGAVFRQDAALARALLLANQHDIPVEIRRRYADAGIIHMLSISGLHVTILAGAVSLLFGAARFPPRSAALATVLVIGLYVWLIGWPPPAVRSAVTLGAAVWTRMIERHTSPWAVLALGGLVPLLTPATVLDLGYQLSIAGMAGLFAARGLSRRLVRDRAGHAARLARALLASAAATLVTAPLVAASFGRLSLIAPLTNLLADPIIAIAQPMLFLALLLAPVPWLARFVADAVHPLLLAFDGVATLGASVPYGAIAVSVSPLGTACAAVACIAFVVACVARFPARAALAGTAALAIAACLG